MQLIDNHLLAGQMQGGIPFPVIIIRDHRRPRGVMGFDAGALAFPAIPVVGGYGPTPGIDQFHLVVETPTPAAGIVGPIQPPGIVGPRR